MSRTARLSAITRIVRAQAVANQKELVAALAERGIKSTQATVSRDVRHLGLIKVAVAAGGFRYLPPDGEIDGEHALESLRSLFQQSVTRIETGEALLIINTPSGFGNAVAASVDQARLKEVAGTIAGDDTILVVLRDAAARERVLEQFRQLIE